MNNDNSSFNNFQNDEDSFDFISEFFKYFFFWKYFLVSILIFLFLALIINRYTPKIFKTQAKIQILDKKQNNLEMPSAEDLFSSSKINLENEIEIIKSASILNNVIYSNNVSILIMCILKKLVKGKQWVLAA